jgi:hypothetical protein
VSHGLRSVVTHSARAGFHLMSAPLSVRLGSFTLDPGEARIASRSDACGHATCIIFRTRVLRESDTLAFGLLRPGL